MSELKLIDREWGEFSFSQIFKKIQRGKRLTKSNQIIGLTPYISSSAQNNGVDNFISNVDRVRKFSNCLTLANSGSVGSVFFQNYEFVASDHVTALVLEKNNQYVYLFLSAIIVRLEEKYSFNREINDKRIKREKLVLPINENQLPDWQFMESYIKQIEKGQREKIVNYYNSLINKENNSYGGGVNDFLEIKWSEFKISDICEIKSGVRLTKKSMQDGELPFIGATDANNGITNFVDNQNESIDKHVLGVNYNGSVGENFYHPYQCIFSDDVKRLRIRYRVDKYAYLFLKNVILQQKAKYQYGYKFNATRMSKQKIFLPIDDNKQPNWQFMQDYMKSLGYQKLQKYLTYCKEKLS